MCCRYGCSDNGRCFDFNLYFHSTTTFVMTTKGLQVQSVTSYIIYSHFSLFVIKKRWFVKDSSSNKSYFGAIEEKGSSFVITPWKNLLKNVYENTMLAENVSNVECVSFDFRKDDGWKFMITEAPFREDVYQKFVNVMFNIVDLFVLKLNANDSLNSRVRQCLTAITRIIDSFNKESESVTEYIETESDSFVRFKNLLRFINFMRYSICELYIQQGAFH